MHTRYSDTVRALKRGLDVLKFINRQGVCKVSEIATALDIPRPTVYRLLETLEEEGYVAFSSTSKRVRVTRMAASLSDGFAATTEVCQLAGPLLAKYSKKLVWPLDLSTYDNGAMVIQETTHMRSPLSIDRGMSGFRLPMLRTSPGRCYLAFCPPEERRMIIEHIRRLQDPLDPPFLLDHVLLAMIKEVQFNGYATRIGQEFQSKTSSFAVPVFSSGRVVACVSMVWTREAMTLKQSLKMAEKEVKEIATKIKAGLDT
ncbi:MULTISPECIES: DNA-binding transcriptional regulator [Grimontia]|uniref:Putative HTH-type transcriptional regulator RhmR n=1 Tax=Grimontia marina TaxID=646534 RepID=A0A128EXT5_9GAMM|nr:MULTISPECIES: DNA-binding transcriptional regulator [Grimontia]WRV98225.1 DNA-binding transcriptional regulator [Grimontia sp. NTOU-MAR1]CZF79379.1 putative HTH-type transcriptional regulator RhmR [Grimontia marina]